MTIPEFPGNSKLPPKQDEKKIESVVTGEVSSRQKPVGRRFKEMFLGGDSRSVFQYIMGEVILPQVKDLINEAVSRGVEQMIFGDTRGGTRTRGISRASGPTNYSRYSRPVVGERPGRDERPPPTVQIKSFEDIILATHVEAEMVLDRMKDLIEEYGTVSVADLYSLIGWSSTHMDNKWGWDDLTNARIQRVMGREGGYALNLPRSISL